MTRAELTKLAEQVWDININPRPDVLTQAVLDLRSALLKVIRHIEQQALKHDPRYPEEG